MTNGHIPWYVRLPDGRVITAKSTASVRHHVESGNIPPNSMARQNQDEEWTSLAWIAEFADLVGGSRNVATIPEDSSPSKITNGSSADINLNSGVSSRLDPLRLQSVGIRGFVDDLIAAFDRTVSTGKLMVACVTCALGALAIQAVMRLTLMAYADGTWLALIFGGITALVFFATVTTLLTRQTHLEISQMRPVLPSEANKNAGPFILRVFLGYGITIGLAIGAILLAQRAPGWTANLLDGLNRYGAELAVTVVVLLGVVVAVAMFAMILMSFLLPPVLIVEECSLGTALSEWRTMLRQHRLRLMIYEGLALGLAVIAALPVALPIYLAYHFGPETVGNVIGQAIPFAMWGLAIAPAIAFLAVANLFIYLNLRYENR